MEPSTTYSSAKNAKELLDMIGKDVYKTVKNESEQRSNGDLKGSLTHATFSGGERASSLNPCSSDYTKHFNANSNRYPCRKDGTVEYVDRFSKESGGECANSKIKDNYKGSNDKDVGACAPYRRLSLCNKNFQNNNNDHSSNAKHNLLLDVCMAAKYEGESLNTYSAQYDLKYPGSGFTLCTMLARSFADIGDIIRGKDLYIHNNLMKDLKNDTEKMAEAGKRYNDTTNFFQLREDWWDANRETVWEAITCEAGSGKYFRPTCGDSGSPHVTPSQCRCEGANAGKGSDDVNIVPTYFDYVPQFLRWFEEWAEDFCRKKKKYVDIFKTYCLDEKKGKYCSLNGCDCTKTVRAKGKCTDCLFACHRYENWIDNQRKQFLKQKNKYADEIKKYINEASVSTTRRAARNENYDGYEKKFYEKLKDSGYENVNKFLKKLSDEEVCKKVQDGGTIHFEKVNSVSTNGDGGGTAGSGGTSGTSGTNNEDEGTFYRSKYCQPCPYCGMKKTEDGKGWEKKEENDQCNSGKLYEPKPGVEGTPIKILKSGENHDDIETKLKAFCEEKNGTDGSGVAAVSGTSGSASNSDSQKLYEEWKCYKHDEVQKVGEGVDDLDDLEYHKEVENAGGLCILKNKNKEEKKEKEKKSEKEPEQFQKTYNDFFNFWVAHMLKDSIHWRTRRLRKCINDGTTMKCINGCNTKCVLEWILEEEFLKGDSEEKSEEKSENSLDAQELKHLKEIKKILDEEKKREAAAGGTGKKKTLMDKLIEHELTDANKCLQKCQETQKPSAGGGGDVRSDADTPTPRVTEDEDEDEEDEDEEEEEKEEKEEAAAKDTTEDTGETTQITTQDAVDTGPKEGEKGPSQEDPKVCETVDKALKDKLDDACRQKYSGNNSRLGWKCIPSDTKSSDGSDATTGDKGSICVPPRRRRLYVKKLHDWANSDETTKGPKSQETSEASSQSGKVSSQSDKLREAFIQSAAVETFFLWDRYKKIKAKEEEEKKRRDAELQNAGLDLDGGTLSVEQTPETSLKSGTIPIDFLRQMFYTLGDYRDILFSGGTSDSGSGSKDNTNNDKTNIVLLVSENQDEMDKIQQEIDKVIKQSGEQTGGKPVKPNGTTPQQTWWSQNGEHIWKGMVCALTYKENENSKKIEKDGAVYEKFFGNTPDNPGTTTATQNGKFESKYKYDIVKLEDTSGAKTGSSSPSGGDPINNPKLKDFVEIPTYFRYLHEWGQNFCKERRKRLKDIKYECRGENVGDKYCSGDGENCDDNLPADPSIFPDFYCPSCSKPCGLYKRWIQRKSKEFEDQQKLYVQQKQNYLTESKCAEGNDHDKEFCGKLEKDAADFLEKLGPCSKTNSGEGKRFFENEGEAFRPAKNCEPCSQFKVKCEKGNCVSDSINEKCKGKNITITADRINGSTEDIGMVPCMKNGEGPPCIDNYKKKYQCVLQWINTKKAEWEKIKKHYEKQKPKNGDKDLKTLVTDILRALQPQTDVNKAIKPCPNLDKFEKSCGLNGDEKSKTKGDDERDLVVCLVENLEKQIQECEKKHAKTGGENQTTCGGNTPPDDEDLLLEETEENQVKAPKICPKQTVEEKKETEEEIDGTCEAAAPPPSGESTATESEETNPEQSDGPPALAPEAPTSTPSPRPKPPPQVEKNPWEHPIVIPALVTSTLAWSVGIGFAAFTYFYLK
ncbi:hypothetical protein PFTANZ_05900, partial [Plasmodium falciparum Tanzania (2000708)]